MDNLSKIKSEIEKRIERIEISSIRSSQMDGAEIVLKQLLSFVESLEEEREEVLDFVEMLDELKERQKRVKLPELIDFWWMQEDKDGNRMIAKAKEHFAHAMKISYSVGVSQGESLKKEQFIGETMMEKDKIDSAFTKMMEKEQYPKIKGWIARDVFGKLRIYGNDKADGIGIPANELEITDFWQLCTTDDPVKVELTIHKV